VSVFKEIRGTKPVFVCSIGSLLQRLIVMQMYGRPVAEKSQKDLRITTSKKLGTRAKPLPVLHFSEFIYDIHTIIQMSKIY
jgi:hypothetical protein